MTQLSVTITMPRRVLVLGCCKERLTPGVLPKCTCTPSVGSKTAKEGYKEEARFCDDFNQTDSVKHLFRTTFGLSSDVSLEFKPLGGTTKTDCTSADGQLRIQVKKGKKGQFGQVDRHWVKDVVEHISGLQPISNMLVGLCEYPLKPDGQTVDKSGGRKLLNNTNYSQSQLDEFVDVLENHKREIVEFVLNGTSTTTVPTHLAYVSYVGQRRDSLRMWQMTDLIDHLCTHSFSIAPNASTFRLGNILTFQRKGGDSGKKPSNQIQAKIVLSNVPSLTNKPSFEYKYPQTA